MINTANLDLTLRTPISYHVCTTQINYSLILLQCLLNVIFDILLGRKIFKYQLARLASKGPSDREFEDHYRWLTTYN